MTATPAVLDECSDAAGLAGEALKYRLDVLAGSVAEVVAAAGGWVFDRVMAGWQVNVLTSAPGDFRPLEVLGARGFDLDTVLASTAPTGRPDGLAVGTALYERDERIRDVVLAAVGRGSIEVTLWGADTPGIRSRPMSVMEHSLTAAARAFKGHALGLATVAGGARSGASPTERFRVYPTASQAL